MHPDPQELGLPHECPSQNVAHDLASVFEHEAKSSGLAEGAEHLRLLKKLWSTYLAEAVDESQSDANHDICRLKHTQNMSTICRII